MANAVGYNIEYTVLNDDIIIKYTILYDTKLPCIDASTIFGEKTEIFPVFERQGRCKIVASLPHLGNISWRVSRCI